MSDKQFDLILALLVLYVGFSCFARARREGKWSWRLFAKVMVGVAVLLAASMAFLFALIHLGLKNPLLIVFLFLGFVLFGVVFLAAWCRPETSQESQVRYREGQPNPTRQSDYGRQDPPDVNALEETRRSQ